MISLSKESLATYFLGHHEGAIIMGEINPVLENE